MSHLQGWCRLAPVGSTIGGLLDAEGLPEVRPQPMPVFSAHRALIGDQATSVQQVVDLHPGRTVLLGFETQKFRPGSCSNKFLGCKWKVVKRWTVFLVELPSFKNIGPKPVFQQISHAFVKSAKYRMPKSLHETLVTTILQPTLAINLKHR